MKINLELEKAKKEMEDKFPTKSFGEINIERQWYWTDGKIDDRGWRFLLYHSCGEWEIGNLEKAEKFNQDLTEAIEYYKKYL